MPFCFSFVKFCKLLAGYCKYLGFRVGKTNQISYNNSIDFGAIMRKFIICLLCTFLCANSVNAEPSFYEAAIQTDVKKTYTIKEDSYINFWVYGNSLKSPSLTLKSNGKTIFANAVTGIIVNLENGETPLKSRTFNVSRLNFDGFQNAFENDGGKLTFTRTKFSNNTSIILVLSIV